MKKVELPLEEVRALMDAGHSYRDLAQRFGCSVGRVAAFAKEHKLGDRVRAESSAGRRRPGRPARGENPMVVWRQIDDLLVQGRTAQTPHGTTTEYPSYRELAQEFQVSASLIGQYSLQHRCLERRRERQTAVVTGGDTFAPSAAPVPAASAPGTLDAKASVVRDHQTLEAWGERFREDLREGRVATQSVRDFIDTVRAKRELEAAAGTEGSPDQLAELLARLERGKLIHLERQRMIIECPDVAGVASWNDAHWQRSTGTELPDELRPPPSAATGDDLAVVDLPAGE